MEAPLRRLIRCILLGKKEMLESRDLWLCASCHICQIRCPRGINIKKVIDALKKAMEPQTKYIVFCRICGKPFSTTPLINFIADCLGLKENEIAFDLCPACKRRNMGLMFKHLEWIKL
jgi:Fe-S oxidoreductase